MSETAHTLPLSPSQAASPDRSSHDRSSHDRFWGMVHGTIGMVIFAGSLPATRAAVIGLDTGFITAGRAAITGLLAIALLAMRRQRLPRRKEWFPLLVVAGGVVLGFPLLSALALRSVPATHAIVFVGMLPLMTALFAVLRAGERPRAAFWPWAVAGSAVVGGYAMLHDGAGFAMPDLFMLGAILVCGLGYAEGSRLSRQLGSWQTICWALIISLPVSLPVMLLRWPAALADVPLPSWIGFAYVSLLSMFIGFFFWYRGLSLGGAARVGQIQLFQPFLGLALAALTLGEHVSPDIFAVAAIVGLCVWRARRYA
jgi:drug/metabolite transporter (DMT)-like permease